MLKLKMAGVHFFPKYVWAFRAFKSDKKSFRKSLLQFSYVNISECVNNSRVPFHALCTQHAKWVIFLIFGYLNNCLINLLYINTQIIWPPSLVILINSEKLSYYNAYTIQLLIPSRCDVHAEVSN